MPANLRQLTNITDISLLSTHTDRQGVDGYCLFVFFLCMCVCMVTDFSAEDKAIGVKFCTAVCRRLGRESSIFVNFAFPEAQNRTNRPARTCCNVTLLGFCHSLAYRVRAACGRRIGMCGYTSVPEDGRTCYIVVEIWRF